jgi:hypothetical protein
MIRVRSAPAALLAALLATLAVFGMARPADAYMKLDAWHGHVAFGYAKLSSDSLAPAGSISVAAGIDYPLTAQWRLGATIAFNLLGSSQTKRGSVNAGLDYAMFDVALMASYQPKKGPFTHLAFGPGLALPHADLSVAGGGAAFGDLTVSEAKPEFAADLTLGPRINSVVGVGLEFGARIVPVTQGTWTVWTARFAIHY